jgi:antitoxin CptB
MEKEILIKQLLYRSNHRGCKETDILLGRFFNEKSGEFDEKKLQLYNEFISEDDMLIYDWILGKVVEDKKYLNLILEIRQFHNI